MRAAEDRDGNLVINGDDWPAGCSYHQPITPRLFYKSKLSNAGLHVKA